MRVGTAVKFQTTIDVDGGGTIDSVTIAIENPSGGSELAATAMTDEGSNVYTYVWQSADDDAAGLYTATIKAVSGSYTGKSCYPFTLEAC